MNIDVGIKFKVVWIGHEVCYEGRVYKAKRIHRDCTCTKPSFLFPDGNPPPRRSHMHIEADMVECPFSGIDKRGFWFGPLDEDTLHDIDDPDNSWIEPIYTHGIQLSLF